MSIIAKNLDIHKNVYGLPVFKHKEKVSEEFFKFYNQRHYFAVVVIYNVKGEFLLVRDFNKNIGWELPGGYINEEENIGNALTRIVQGETGLEIDELTPIAVLKNIFKCDTREIVHSGIAFTALSRGHVKLYPRNIKGYFTDQAPITMAYQNSKVISLAVQKIKQKKFNPPFNEIESTKNRKIPLLLNNYLVKNISNFSSKKIMREIFSLVKGKPMSILDVSCGDSSLINELFSKYKPRICIGNDISWEAISHIKDKNPNILFSNHNVLELPFRMKFDLVIFKNTLHHIERKYQKHVIEKLQKISKQLIIVDVDDPKNLNLLSKIWNNYYVYVLGDQGDSFLTFNEFKKMFDTESGFGNVGVGRINTIKGKYFFASISNT